MAALLQQKLPGLFFGSVGSLGCLPIIVPILPIAPGVPALRLRRLLERRAVIGGRLPDDFSEDAIEVRDRLESDLKRRFTHPLLRIEQARLGGFHADACQVFRKGAAGRLLELFAEVEGAHVDGPCHLAQRQILGVVRGDVFTGARDVRRLGIFSMNRNLI